MAPSSPPDASSLSFSVMGDGNGCQASAVTAL
jgi:hypothetical protein